MTRIGIDVGGTFTDVVLYGDHDERLTSTKAFSSLDRPGAVIADALADLGVERADVRSLVHATTLVTNLVIERRGARVGLLTTAGFRDVLEIGLSYREHPYDLQGVKTQPLVPRPLRREIEERVAADGSVLVELNVDDVIREARHLVERGVEAIAIVFLHSYANAQHEARARQVILDELPDLFVSTSSDVDPQVREFERTSTTVMNAYAMPAVGNYDAQLALEFERRPGEMMYMHSGGGVVPPERACARPIELVSSGPAGGVLAAAFLGRRLGISDLVTFDVGGTSSDVCVVEDGEVQERDAIEVEWGMPLRVRCIDVTWVGAGGGSIGWVDEGDALAVGPRSAGAAPGPACYGRGGVDPTVTDANLLLGILDPDRFLGGRVPLDVEAAEAALDRLAGELDAGRLELALGIRRIAIANMAQAVNEITVQKGIDPRSFTLVAFGGAGGQHATDVADELELGRVLFPPLASTFAALGLLCAETRVTERKAFLHPVSYDSHAAAECTFGDLRQRAESSFGGGGVARTLLEHRFAQLRYQGQTHELTLSVDGDDWRALPARFEEAHERRFGTRLGEPVETVALGVTLVAAQSTLSLPAFEAAAGTNGSPSTIEVLGIDGPVSVVDRATLPRGARITGPTIVYEPDSTIVVGPGWVGDVGQFGELLCVRDQPLAAEGGDRQ